MKAFDFMIVATDSETNVPVVIAHGWNTGGSEYLTVHPEGEETYFALKEMMGRTAVGNQISYESETVAIPLESREACIEWVEGQWWLGRHVAYCVIKNYLGLTWMVCARISQLSSPGGIESFDLLWNC